MPNVARALTLAVGLGDSALEWTALVAVAGLIAIALRNELRGRRFTIRVGKFHLDVGDEPKEPPRDEAAR